LTFFYLLDVVAKLWIPQGSDKSIEKHCILLLQNNIKNKDGSEKWSSPKEWVGHAETKVNGVLVW